MELKVCDSTLRDGEQQACINFTQDQKLEIADLLQRLGIDSLDMMPCQNEVEQETVRLIVERGMPVVNLTPLNKRLIDQSLSLSPRILLFQAVSDELLSIRYKTDNIQDARRQNLDAFVQHGKYVKERCPTAEVSMAGEDSAGADESYLKELIRAITPYCDDFHFADSKGIARPEEIRSAILQLSRSADIEIGIHTHNDLGNADANAVAAIKAGATVLSGTITGIGERAGNCDIRKVLELLKADDIIFSNIDYDLFDEAEAVVREYAGRERSKPLSERAFWHETGIHVNALLTDPAKGYCAVDPKTLGLKHQIFFGKKSGISSFKYFFGCTFSNEQLIRLRDLIKEVSLRENRSYSYDEMIAVIAIRDFELGSRLKEVMGGLL